MWHSFKRLYRIRKDVDMIRFFEAIMRRIADIPNIVAFFFPFGFSKKNRIKLSSFQDIHKGKRCFIIANGPSLKDVDFDLLKDEYTIGMNRIYLMKNQCGFTPSYLACVDVKSQLMQFTDEYNEQDGTCFYEWNLRRLFEKKENFVFIKSKFSPVFSKKPHVDPFGSGQSVTYSCMQLAYFMGFSEVYIIGKDHSYNIANKGGSTNKSTGNESNHFIAGYYKKGQTWGTPDYLSEEYSYKLAREAFENDGRTIMNATKGSKLDVFEMTDFNSLFQYA